jgi:hypothetical protein
MTPTDSDETRPVTGATPAATRGDKVSAVFDYLIKIVTVTVVVVGVMLVIIALSGVGLARMDEHAVFRYRMYAAPVLIVGYLLMDYLLTRRRARRAADALTRSGAAHARKEFALSIDPDAARRAAEAAAANEVNRARPKRGYTVELMALAFVAAGAAAFWHDHMSNEIPNPVAVPATFVSAKCVEGGSSRIGGSIGPHMLIVYEFVSQSTSVRVPEMKCLLDNCESEKKPRQYMDGLSRRAFYASVPACNAALPAVLTAKAPTTVWTGDKDPNASVRARFTPERDTPPYFLLWFPAAVAAVVLLTSGFARTRGRR